MTDRLRPEPEASAELEDAALWYEGQRPGLGLELVQAVDLALEQIAGWPQIFRADGSMTPRHRQDLVGRFRIENESADMAADPRDVFLRGIEPAPGY